MRQELPAVVRPLVVGIVLVSLFTFFFVYPLHDPKPNDLPVGIFDATGYGPSTEGYEVKQYPDEEAARQAILDREIYGASSAGKTLVSSAASFTVAQTLKEMAGDAEVVDVRPVAKEDPRGLSINFTILPLSVTAILGALLLFQLAPAVTPPTRLAALTLFALVGGITSMLIAHVAIGAIPGPFLALAGLAALAIAAMATASSGLMQRLGPPGIGLSFLIFLMLGNPASGAASAPELLPDPWKDGGQFLPPGALGTGLRNVAYFDGAALTRPLLVLLAITALGVVLVLTGPRGSARACPSIRLSNSRSRPSPSRSRPSPSSSRRWTRSPTTGSSPTGDSAGWRARSR